MRRLIGNQPRKAKAPARERGPAMLWRRHLLRALPVGLPLLVALVLGGWVVLGGIGQQRIDAAARIFDAVTADAGLSVERVLVDGRVRTDRQSLIDALGVDVGAPILGVEIATARARVGALPWIREVTVERRLPDTLLVRIVERRPLAVWQNGGSVAVVDVDGQVIDGARPRDFPELLLVVGPDAPVMAADLLAVMARTPDLSTRVTAAVRVGSRRWNLKLDDGIEVQMPEEDLAGAWTMLVDLDRSEQLLARDVQSVDLRLPDRLVLRLTPDAQARMALAEVEGEDT